MLKNIQKNEVIYNEKPRKLIKLNVQSDQNYNEYKGQFLQIQTIESRNINNSYRNNQEDELKFKNYEDQKKRNTQVFTQIKMGQKKMKIIPDVKRNDSEEQQKNTNKMQVSNKKQDLSQSTKYLQEKKNKKSVKKTEVNGLSNWQKFKNSRKNVSNDGKNDSIKQFQFAAVDCQFVRHNEQQLLARISMVSQNGDCLYDSYVHPDKLITDYVKDISGITYAHIKNAPKMSQVIDKVKKCLINKTIIGHTIWKDMEVCGLKNWKGYKYLVDIAEYNDFKQKNGKLISLKNLSIKHLGKKIQDGVHSSVEDAETTMNLFKLRKKEILKQFKIIS